MSDLKAPTVLEELFTLWRLATPAERTRFLARAAGTGGHSPAEPERGAAIAAGGAR